jgi:hypothetical protein
LAEAFVNLSSFRRKTRSDVEETTGEPIDVPFYPKEMVLSGLRENIILMKI